MATIFKYSLITGTLPFERKSAKETDTYKSGDTQGPSNYRPISALSICMKSFERLSYNQLHVPTHNGAFVPHSTHSVELVAPAARWAPSMASFKTRIKTFFYLDKSYT